MAIPTDFSSYKYQLEKYKTLMMDAYQAEQAERKQTSTNEDTRNAQLAKWQEAVEELAKVEAMLAGLIAQEINSTHSQSISAGSRQMAMNWSGRLDTIIGELSRYRETLMRRVTDGLMPRLIGTTNDNASNAPV